MLLGDKQANQQDKPPDDATIMRYSNHLWMYKSGRPTIIGSCFLSILPRAQLKDNTLQYGMFRSILIRLKLIMMVKKVFPIFIF